MYTFYYDLKKEQLLEYLKVNTREMKFCGTKCLGAVSMRVDENKIKLQMKKIMCHPLQRVFVGEISEEDDKTVIKGGFKYPVVCAAIFTMLFFVFITLNIFAFKCCSDMVEQIAVCVFFAMLYGFWFFVFIGNKWMYRNEEKNVIDLLKSFAAKVDEE